jgi:tetratricopeptide (TPR) repeat protein
LPPGPDIPEWADPRDLDPAVRTALRGLDPRGVDKVAGHLVAAGTLVDEDPEAALAHARAARDRASRVAVVREAVGVAAYHAGDYAEAARELRAYRRMSGDEAYRAVLADCERALGRPEVALRLVAEALTESPDEEEQAELRLVEAGARRDLGEDAAARLVLEAALGGRPTPDSLVEGDEVGLRFAAAYADLLHAQGEEALAQEWHDAVTALDPDALADSVEFTEIEEVELAEDEGDGADDDTEAETAADADTDGESDANTGGDAPVGDQDDDAEFTDAESLEAAIEVEFSSAGTDGPGGDGAGFPTTGRSFQDEVEAEVAELLGETGEDADDPGIEGSDSTKP